MAGLIQLVPSKGPGMPQALTTIYGLWLCSIWLVACGSRTGDLRTQGHGIAGQRSDVITREGAYGGYRVSRACREADCIGVTGTGARWYPGMERERLSEPAFMTAFEELRGRALHALEGTPVRSSALGQGCTALGLVIGLGDWRLVDGAIVRVGRLLRDQDLREEITICVEPEIQLLQKEVQRVDG